MSFSESVRTYVARRIREMRSSYGGTGLSQEALAQKIGVSTNTISRWETGTYEPTLNDLEALSRELGLSILEFFPQVAQTDEKSKRVDALLRAAKSLNESDLEELRRYAEFRRARSTYIPKTAGRKRK
jgi:transcriptional regulator with XRE-family HTH domain